MSCCTMYVAEVMRVYCFLLTNNRTCEVLYPLSLAYPHPMSLQVLLDKNWGHKWHLLRHRHPGRESARLV
jgi:hypothetical protein